MARELAVLVLGRSGMLGATVFHRLRHQYPAWRIDGTTRPGSAGVPLDAEAGRPGLADAFRGGAYAYAINCIGVLKNEIDANRSDSVERAIRINALFPHELAEVAADHGARVIHVSTDAVFSGRSTEAYDEASAPDPTDVYGSTKALGESPAPNTLNVRCSIVGRDTRRRGLVEWYLAARTPVVTGFVDYVWTPITTVQFADWCGRLLDGRFDAVRAAGHVVHLAPNPAMSKAEFLEAVRAQVGEGPVIERRSAPGGPCVRILASREDEALEAPWPTPLAELMSEFSSRGV